MRNGLRGLFPCAALLAVLWVSGCAYTVAGTKLAPITPPHPPFQSLVEHTVGDFSFTLEGGKMVTSNFVGHMLSKEIVNSWKERGYVRDAVYVESGAFSHTADYNLTLNGTQYGESSIGMQILSGLTLTLLPYTVTQHYDITYAVEDVKSGEKYSAGIQETDTTYVELFLLLALPVSQRGHKDTVQRMGDHLYEQLYRHGAFQRPAEASVASPDVPSALRRDRASRQCAAMESELPAKSQL